MPNPFIHLNSSILKNHILEYVQSFVYTHLNVKTVLCQRIQFSISTQFNFILPIDRTLSSTTTPVQIEPGSDSNEGVLRIP